MNNILIGAALLLLQFLLAAPWVVLAFLSPQEWRALREKPFAPWVMQRLAVVLAICIMTPVLVVTFLQDRGSLEIVGRIYAGVLQTQVTVDLFILGFGVLLVIWPKGGAVALAAFREGVRQWLFWLLTLMGAMAMFISIFIPYFTFGEDYLMVKQLGYDTIMLVAIIFGALTASLSISEEIEGRTAITVMSKPISRRQFMLGKYVGIVLAALFMFGVLGVMFEGVLLVKHWWEKLDSFSNVQESQLTQVWIGVVPTPRWVNATVDGWRLPGQVSDVVRGAGQWLAHTLDTLPGLVLCYSQVMVLVGLAVALATRLPMVVNLTGVLVVFFLSHLTQVLLSIAKRRQESQPGNVSQILAFVTRVFDTILPDLSSFSMDPALVSDVAPNPALFAQYVGAVTMYGVVYTGIVLLFGLILFEDRDLA
jgi:hypothetical protein